MLHDRSSDLVEPPSREISQHRRNPQPPSEMPFQRYEPKGLRASRSGKVRRWPSSSLERAPLWASVDLRDGNQSLPEPMDVARKSRMFELLVRTGFKEIEIGYPSASSADFKFVRQLITTGTIPNDVVVSVFTAARPDLIARTFEAIEGLEQGIVHLCNATACLWREVVFAQSAASIKKMATESAMQIACLAEAMPRSDLRFEYSPETFNITEPEFALEVCESVMDVWSASPLRPVTINLPTTVETDTPNVYADQIEWMNDSLTRRDSAILSVHPHNDRGTAVAAAELALMAGADRVEGTLFGNGERTGNVCLATLALNLFSHGIDPQVDLGDIDEIKHVVEYCNRLPVHPRHPYVGDLVYTAFSGTHQDAIAKGLSRLRSSAAEKLVAPESLPWDVPYLPIDPKDVGRTYESVVRVNSQSGGAGITEALREAYGLALPRAMRTEFASRVQSFMDENGCGVTSKQLWEMLQDFYACPEELASFRPHRSPQPDSAAAVSGVLACGSSTRDVSATTEDDIPGALMDALRALGLDRTAHPRTTTQVLPGPEAAVVAITETSCDDVDVFGFGVATYPSLAVVRSVLSAAGRAASVSPART
jgi:2-isopropylmalate synthase